MNEGKGRRGGRTRRVGFESVRRLAADLPGIEDGTSYGTPALKVKGKLLVRLKEDGETIAIRVDADTRDLLTEADPKTFYDTDHYRPYPWMLVRLPRVRPDALRRLLEQGWRAVAPKRLLAEASAPREGSSSRTRRVP